MAHSMHISVNLLMMCLGIMISLIKSNSAESQAPKQQECLTQSSFSFDPTLVPLLPKEWYVARATMRTLLRKGLPEPTMNNCTPMTYFESCDGAIYIERTWAKDGSVTKMTKAYSAECSMACLIHIESDLKFMGDNVWLSGAQCQNNICDSYLGQPMYDNIAEYWEDQKRVDPNYFVWQSVGKSTRWYTLISYGFVAEVNKVSWVLYLDCDEDFGWIEIAKYVYDNPDLLEEVEEDINQYLQEPPIPLIVPQMAELETQLPF